MLPTENGRCPDCGCELNTRGTRCCDNCSSRRKIVMAERLANAENVGCGSSPESFEMSNLGGGVVGGNGDYRNVPGLRTDVTWHRGKHGAG
jgi:hypothetical protein